MVESTVSSLTFFIEIFRNLKLLKSKLTTKRLKQLSRTFGYSARSPKKRFVSSRRKKVCKRQLLLVSKEILKPL